MVKDVEGGIKRKVSENKTEGRSRVKVYTKLIVVHSRQVDRASSVEKVHRPDLLLPQSPERTNSRLGGTPSHKNVETSE